MATHKTKINSQAIRKLMRDFQKEVDKHPVQVPLQMSSTGVYPTSASVTNYNGPVVTVNGDHAQLAWSNNQVNQGQAREEQQIAPGFEQLAATLTELLASLPALALAQQDSDEVRENVEVVLAEVVNDEPNPGIIKRALTMIKGLLSPVATSVSQAVGEESAQIAREAIQALGEAAPF
ncbi:hypothetical protein ACWDOP_00425 [Nocardia sp. NPDC003693]